MADETIRNSHNDPNWRDTDTDIDEEDETEEQENEAPLAE